MRKAGAKPDETFHVEYQPNDTVASWGAGVMAIGAGWGLAHMGPFQASRPDHLFMSVHELWKFLLYVANLLHAAVRDLRGPSI